MAAAWVARCRAALAFAFALAEAPFRRRRPPPGAGAVAGKGEVEQGEVGAGGSSSTSSLAFNLPSFVVKNDKEAAPPASFVCRSNFSSSPSILCSNLNKRKWQSPKDTSFHFRGQSIFPMSSCGDNFTLNNFTSHKLSMNREPGITQHVSFYTLYNILCINHNHNLCCFIAKLFFCGMENV